MLSNHTSKIPSGLAIAIVLGFTLMPSADAQAACNVTINGYPMSAEDCRLAAQVYGRVEPGHYWMDNAGNWGSIGSSAVRGNLYRDGQRNSQQSNGSSFGGRGYNGIYDGGRNGCEGGSCVNILD